MRLTHAGLTHGGPVAAECRAGAVGTTKASNRSSSRWSGRAVTAAAAHAGQPGEHALDLGQIDPHPPDLHDVVQPAGQVQPALGVQPAPVTGPADPLADG